MSDYSSEDFDKNPLRHVHLKCIYDRVTEGFTHNLNYVIPDDKTCLKCV